MLSTIEYPDKCRDCVHRVTNVDAVKHRYNGIEPYNGECSLFYGNYFWGKLNCPGYEKENENQNH